MNFILRAIAVLAVCLIIGFGIGKKYSDKNCNSTNLTHINPDLICSKPYVIDKSAYSSLESKLEELIKSKTSENKITEAAIYFRDLKNGPTLGINEYSNFSPASLLKLPLLIAFLDQAEKKPEILEEKLTFELIKDPYTPLIPPQKSIKQGEVYSIDDLLGYMIKYSDNQAYFVLLEYLHQISPNHDLLADTFKDLGIIDPKTISDDTINVKSYASIFVQLYHVSFLRSNEMSEKALNLLAESQFDEGIKAGVPKDLAVAHKFGERQLADGLKQFHDCGIVYYPVNPYLVCIMTRGNDFQELIKSVGEISKIIYEEFDSRKL